MSETPAYPEGLNHIQLEAAVCNNDFAQEALKYYYESVKAHEEGEDFGEFRQGEKPKDIEVAMTQLGLVLDKPAVGAHFATHLPLSRQMDVYFDAIMSPNQAGEAVLSQLGNIKSKLEQYPGAYCKFLIREIADLHQTDTVDIDKNTRDVLTLVSDKVLFPDPDNSELDRLINYINYYDDYSYDDYMNVNLSSSKNELKTALNNGLMKADRPDLLVATTTQNLEQVQETATQFQLVGKSEHDQLNWREKHRLRKVAQSVLNITRYSVHYWESSEGRSMEEEFLIVKPTSKILTAVLALALVDDQKKLQSDHFNHWQVTPRGFAQKSARSFIESRPKFITEAYKRNFPEEALKGGADLEDVLALQSLPTSLQQTSAEEFYTRLVEDEKKPPTDKLLAAVSMAKFFNDEMSGTKQQAYCMTLLDMLQSETSRINELDGLVAKSQRHQELSKELNSIIKQINQIGKADPRDALLKRVEIIKDQLASGY